MDDDQLAFAGAAEQARRLVAGTVTAPALLGLCLARIARLDPELNAFRIVLADSARAEADAAQLRLDAGERAPLLGVPVAIKDDTDVAGQITAWGTAAHGPAKTADAAMVTALRQAGAVIVGKTNVSEMTIWPFTETLTFGATRNPWDLNRTPGGSSGGTGAAVAAGLVGLATGSDGGGSIRIPATWCGLYGIKPQRDRVSLAPHADAWQGLGVKRVPFQAMFNATGQPAAAVPWGLDAQGLPMSVQLVGRPSDESTLLSLSAQIESARPWAQRRPPVS